MTSVAAWSTARTTTSASVRVAPTPPRREARREGVGEVAQPIAGTGVRQTWHVKSQEKQLHEDILRILKSNSAVSWQLNGAMFAGNFVTPKRGSLPG